MQLHQSAALLHEYAWCLPAHHAEVSLYDHARLTAALAACLYRLRAISPYPQRPLRLAVGDLSGIQSYIFDIAAVGAAGASRRLRARSFSIALLSDLASHALVQQFDLPLTNILMSSGGKFYVLLPNGSDAEVELRLQDFRRQVDEWLYEHYNGEIGLNLASLPLSARELAASGPGVDGFGALLDWLNHELDREKQQRARSIWQATGQWAEARFVIRQDFGGAGDCASCHKFAITDTEHRLCAQCARQSQLGSKLTRVWGIEFRRAADNTHADITFLGDYQAHVLTQPPSDKPDPNTYLVVRLNDPRLTEVSNFPATFRYLANHIPTETNGAPWDFEQIANSAAGRSLLGYVKADVDFLGTLLAEGLRDEQDEHSRDTAAHTLALSREIELFFSGWLENLLTTEFKTTYTIFSGGDDLFLLAPWSDCLRLAERVNAEFNRFACDNPEVHLSAGILYTKPGYPISRAAADAEDALEKSKRADPLVKNRLTILGDTLEWSKLSTVTKHVSILEKFDDRNLRSAFLYRLTEYADLYRQAQIATTAYANAGRGRLHGWRRAASTGSQLQGVLLCRIAVDRDARDDLWHMQRRAILPA